MAENLGPAGGIAEGMERVLKSAADRDWIVALDDDDPPYNERVLGKLLRFGEAMLTRDPMTGAVGMVGARFDWKRGMMITPSDDELNGPVSVDVIGGNQFPFYLAKAIRDVQPFSRDVFFGLDDLDEGLRLRKAGYSIYADGLLWRELREEAGRRELDRHPSRRLSEVSWRRYYSLRNAIHILRWHGRRRTALRVTLVRGLGKPLANLPISPVKAIRHLKLNWRACRDAWTGRMGRTVEPDNEYEYEN